MGKIIFIDVDGTLVDYEGNLPDSAVKAIRQARANGHRVYMCTGRSKAEVYPPLWDIGLDGIIGGNGCYVEDHGHVVMHQLITLDQCRRVVDWLHERHLEFYLESNNGLFASEHFEEQGAPVMREYSKRKGNADAAQLTVRQALGSDLRRRAVPGRSKQDQLYPVLLSGSLRFQGTVPRLRGRDLGRQRRDRTVRRPGRQGHHQGQCDRASPLLSQGGPKRHHRHRRCQGGHPHAEILCLRRSHGQRRR